MSFGQHIKLRWWQRGERNHPRVAEAWRQGEDVGVPGRPDLNARFHEESKTVIARKTGGGGTVLNSENMILYKDGRLVCGNCMDSIQRDGRCPNRDCSN